jgi:hypothetical protein
MDNPETLAKSGTQDTGQAKHKDTIQHRKQSRMDNPDIGKIRHTQDEDKQNTQTQYNTENNQEWTTQRHWQNQAHQTQDKQNTMSFAGLRPLCA